MILLLDANGALLCVAGGLLLICVEFCLPGRVIPGVAGGVLPLCGAYRLSLLGAALAPAAGLGALLLIAALAGYGALPAWLGWVALPAVPWLCRGLVPGQIAWPPAILAILPPLTLLVLLRIAARAAGNKTLL